MPPKKRKAAAPPPTPAAKTAGGRRSKLAKENDITGEEEAEIKSAWQLFAIKGDDVDVEEYQDEKEGVLRTGDVKAALVAQSLAPKTQKELDEFISILDPEEDGYVTYPHFLEICALQLKNKDASAGPGDEEVQEAFKLFLQGREDGIITVNDLRAVAKVLKEEVGEEVLKAMVLEANGGQGVGKGVRVEDFKQVMTRAGVFK